MTDEIANLTDAEARLKLAALKALFVPLLSREYVDGRGVPHNFYEIETHLSIDEWLDELCAMESDWAADWQDVYMQLTGELVEPWRELKLLVERVTR